MLVYRDHNFELFWEDRPSDMIVLAFSHLGNYTNGITFWGQRVANIAGISIIGVVPSEANWYRCDTTEKLIEAIISIPKSGRPIVAYGSSMGGYAALKFGARLGV